MIKSIQGRTPWEFMTRKDVERIHETSLDILSKTGIVMPLENRRLAQLQEYGVKVDRDKNRLYFPAQVVESALKKAPTSYVLCARNPDYDLPLDGAHGYLSTDGSATQIVDLTSGAIRKSTKNDLREITRIADHLPEISFLWPSVSAQDCLPKVQPLHELEAVLANTEKHVQAMTAVEPLHARGTVDIAVLLAGGKESLKQRPIISNFQCSLSPLSYDGKALEAALIFAEAGVPVGFVTMQIGCSTAPATLAGNLALGNAEILAGITLVELCYPGTPTFYGCCATMMELKRGGVTCGGPEDLLLQSLAAQMARYYRIPASIGTFCTSSKSNDWQAGMENGFSSMVSVFSQADLMSGAGLICAAKVFSIEQMILDCATYDILWHVAKGIEVNEETLAYPVIQKVGPRNHFMTEEHTLHHLDQVWMSAMINRDSYFDWEQSGKPSPQNLARKKAREILSGPGPDPGKYADEIQKIIASYENTKE
ncbi:trimethylamine methyltransferase family protein [Candidatus Formimonas warabiya]|nr:trimethylamine methyltransferase family protein [Candidatus Formimonas warabiya]